MAAGEYSWSLADSARLIAAGAVDCLQLDVTRCGGITGFLAASALAAGASLDVSAHCAPNREAEHRGFRDSEAAVGDEHGRTALRNVLAALDLDAQERAEHRIHEIDELRVVAERIDGQTLRGEVDDRT